MDDTVWIRDSERIKGKVFKVAIKPAMTFSAGTWAIKKTQEMRINVAEMKMLRFACVHTRLDKIENKEIRNRMKVMEMHRKIQEKRL
jgi:GTP-binding protein EngB required for normal cell division